MFRREERSVSSRDRKKVFFALNKKPNPFEFTSFWLLVKLSLAGAGVYV